MDDSGGLGIADLAHIEVLGYRIAHRIAGSGPALVLLHGFLCDSRVWRTQLEELSDGFTVIAWDAPGAGASADPPEPFTITDWAHVLEGFLDRLGLERAHVLGLSWGGLLAQELYRLHASRVLTLVLADTYAGWKGSFSDEVAEQRLERCERESMLPAEEFVDLWVPHEFFTPAVPPEVEAEMRTVVADRHPLGFRLMARSLAEGNTTDFLPGIDVPTLLLWGDQDLRSPMSVGERFRDTIPGSELEVVVDAGHVSNMEQPRAFNDHVRRFCSAHTPSG